MSILQLPLPPRAHIVLNYIGGMGYYALLVTWMLTILLVCWGGLQYVVSDGVLLYDTPVTTIATDGSTPVATVPGVVSGVIALVAAISTIGFVIVLPYFIGLFCGHGTRWLISQTNLPPTLSTQHRVKQIHTACLFVIVIIALYHPGAAATQNLPFFIASGACLTAACLFFVQYKLAALWKVPQHSVF